MATHWQLIGNSMATRWRLHGNIVTVSESFSEHADVSSGQYGPILSQKGPISEQDRDGSGTRWRLPGNFTHWQSLAIQWQHDIAVHNVTSCPVLVMKLVFGFCKRVKTSQNCIVQAICGSDVWWKSSIRANWNKLLLCPQLWPVYRPLSRCLDRCDRVIQNESSDSNGGSNMTCLFFSGDMYAKPHNLSFIC